MKRLPTSGTQSDEEVNGAIITHLTELKRRKKHEGPDASKVDNIMK